MSQEIRNAPPFGCPFKSNFTRRDFVKTSSIAAAGLIAGACSKIKNPVSSQEAAPEPYTSKNIPQHPHEILATVAYSDMTDYEYKNLKSNIEACLNAVGGVSDILPSGGTVGIKVNMTGGEANADKSLNRFGLTVGELFWTHPTILKATCELLLEAGASQIYVMEANYDEPSYTKFGYKDVVDELGIEYINLNNPEPYADFLEVQIPNPLTHWESHFHHRLLHEVDCFVSLPKTKRHVGAGMTNAMKMMIGSVPLAKYAITPNQSWRAKLHSTTNNQNTNNYSGVASLVRTIVDLNKIRPTNLAICDAIKTANNGEGPWFAHFTPMDLNKLFVSKDPVAADAYGTTLFGFDPRSADREGAFAADSLPDDFSGTDNYLRIAEEQGLGIHDIEKIQLIDATASTGVV